MHARVTRWSPAAAGSAVSTVTLRLRMDVWRVVLCITQGFATHLGYSLFCLHPPNTAEIDWVEGETPTPGWWLCRHGKPIPVLLNRSAGMIPFLPEM